MAAITDEAALRFVDEELRPITEMMQLLKVRIDAALVQWFGGISDKIPNSASDTIENRVDEGVIARGGDDVWLLVSQMQTTQTQYDGSGVDAVLSAFAVRSPGA